MQVIILWFNNELYLIESDYVSRQDALARQLMRFKSTKHAVFQLQETISQRIPYGGSVREMLVIWKATTK